MASSRVKRWLLAAVVATVAAALASPALVRAYWRVRSSNPVRRGIHAAERLGCFACHGDLGRGGIPDPVGGRQSVPAWSGGVFMMYVENDDDIRRYIQEGSEPEPASDGSAAGIVMPAYGEVLGGRELDDLVRAFKALSGMSLPPAASAARRGHDLAQRWQCFSCHGPAGCGGQPNPGSFAGFIPGWYGADFRDLVRDRSEFDEWVLSGQSSRQREHKLASFFTRRQRISMPRYEHLRHEDLDDLWAFAGWLAQTDGAP